MSERRVIWHNRQTSLIVNQVGPSRPGERAYLEFMRPGDSRGPMTLTDPKEVHSLGRVLWLWAHGQGVEPVPPPVVSPPRAVPSHVRVILTTPEGSVMHEAAIALPGYGYARDPDLSNVPSLDLIAELGRRHGQPEDDRE